MTLIELMIALVLGLLVSSAALALVASIIKSNTETIRATRLTQELRSTAEVIAREIRRARSDKDPIINIGSPTTLLTACNAIDTSTAGCVTYGYDCTDPTAGTFKAIGLANNAAGNGEVYLKALPTGAPTCPTNTDQLISSGAVKITGMTFAPNPVTDVVTLSLTGQFASDGAGTLAPLTRSITQEIRIRSPQVQ